MDIFSSTLSNVRVCLIIKNDSSANKWKFSTLYSDLKHSGSKEDANWEVCTVHINSANFGFALLIRIRKIKLFMQSLSIMK